jgi:hypothetical protein
MNKKISNKQLILVFLIHFSVALAQNTTGIMTATAMAAANMTPCAPHQCHKWMGKKTPSKRM